MTKIKKKIIKSLLSLVFVSFVSIGLIGGCTTAPEAPFGSEIELLPGIDDISICTAGLETVLIRALVTGPDGLPLNDVAVTFNISFSGDNSLIIDTDGNGLGDSALLQLVDNDACEPFDCFSTPISEYAGFNALVDNGFVDISDDNGIAEVVIIIPGFFNIFDDTGITLSADPAAITVFSGSAEPVSEDFGVNTDCDLPDGP